MTAVRNSRGVALFEAVVAIAILGVVGAGAAVAAAEATDAVARVHAREAEVRAASRLIARIAALDGSDIAGQVGRPPNGELAVVVTRRGALFEVQVRDGRGMVVLGTAVYRPGAP